MTHLSYVLTRLDGTIELYSSHSKLVAALDGYELEPVRVEVFPFDVKLEDLDQFSMSDAYLYARGPARVMAVQFEDIQDNLLDLENGSEEQLNIWE